VGAGKTARIKSILKISYNQPLDSNALEEYQKECIVKDILLFPRLHELQIHIPALLKIFMPKI
jgi:hypothetical protein